jgi:predicted RNA methylase
MINTTTGTLLSDNVCYSIYCLTNEIKPEDFYGDVLYLGMGSCFLPKRQTDNVLSTTIIEIDQSIIESNKAITNSKQWMVVNADVYDYQPDKTYDVIVVDIWFEVQSQTTVMELVNKYKKYLKKDGKIMHLKTIVREAQ